MQRDEICASQQLFELDFFDAHFVGFFFRQEWIERDNLHFQAKCAVAHDTTDVASADNTKRFAGQFDTHEFRLFPFASVGRCRRFWDLTCNRKHHRNRVFCGGDHVAERGVHDNDALFRSGFFVDVVGADTGAANDFEVGRSSDDFVGRFGGRTDRKTVILVDNRQQRVFVFAQLGAEIHVNAAILKDLDGCVGQFIGNQNFGGHDGLLPQ